jgi:BirA family biotin operon repressor/biotin-[acetyl-CoA-carboxylase] ligase
MSIIHRPLTQADLFPNGPLERIGNSLHWFAELPSTNSFLLANADSDLDGAVAWTDFQTAGRGRHGRVWEASRGASVLLSVLLLEPANSPLIQYASVAAAIAVCEAIGAATVCKPRLRWPNDVVISGRKVAGVLAESVARGERRAIVIGVGVNCLQHVGHFSGDLRDKATSLEIDSQDAISRPAVAAAIIQQLDRQLAAMVAEFDAGAALREAWRRHSDDAGRHVRLVENGREFAGTIVELGDEGGLVVQLDEGGRRLFSANTASRAW